MFDPKIGEAINLVRVADADMEKSNTHKAKPTYVKAGELLATLAPAHKSNHERATVTYSAAVCFFKGGEYGRALALLGNINSAALHNMEDFQELFSACKERASHYPDLILQELDKQEKRAQQSDKYSESSCYKKILELLRDHPYIFPPLKMVRKRMDVLKKLGKNEEAEFFREDLERLEKELTT